MAGMKRLLAMVVGAWGLSGCRGWYEHVEDSGHRSRASMPLGDTGPTGSRTDASTMDEQQRRVLSTAVEGDQAGNASLMWAHGGLWVLWENTTQDKSRSLLKLIHTTEDPFQGSWTETEVRRTAGQIKPSVASGRDGVHVLTNECAGSCEDVDFNQGRLDLHPASAPARTSATWPLPNDPTLDVGRGDVAMESDRLVVCFSVEDVAQDEEWLRCDALQDDTWTPVAEIFSDDTADHPCTLLDDNGQLLVGFDGKKEGHREAQIRFPDLSLIHI